MSHSSTSGILKALAELGEGVDNYLLRQVGTLPLVAAFRFSTVLDFIRSESLEDSRPYAYGLVSCCLVLPTTTWSSVPLRSCLSPNAATVLDPGLHALPDADEGCDADDAA